MDLNVCNISHKSLKSLTIYWLLQRNGNVKVHLLFFIVALLSVPSHDCSHFFRVFFPLLWKTGTHLVDRKPCDSVNLCSETVILENLGWLLMEKLNLSNVVGDDDDGITWESDLEAGSHSVSGNAPVKFFLLFLWLKTLSTAAVHVELASSHICFKFSLIWILELLLKISLPDTWCWRHWIEFKVKIPLHLLVHH